jgi:peptidoglycan/LPS O-acetylase OafA/YrhL
LNAEPADRPAGRDVGLDAVRTLAIALVLVSHSTLFFNYGPMVGLLVDYGGWLGVEVFFSLSGFLIGRIMLTLARGRLDRGTVTTFLARRWLRTLPLYYLLLLVLFAAGYPITRVDTFFMHGFVPPDRWGLVTAWSLGVEEYFYLTFPLLMVALVWSRLVGARSAVATTAAIMLAAGWLFRLGYLFGAHPAGVDIFYFRSNPLLRIDACAFGVLLACAMQGRGAWRPGRGLRLALFGGFVAAAVGGLLVLMAIWDMAVWHPDPRYRVPLQVLRTIHHVALWSLIDLASLGAILGLLGVWSPRAGVFAGAIRFGSRTSYALYLFHVPLFYEVTVFAPAWLPAGAAQAALAFGLVLVLAGLSYRWFEAPILAWRDRCLPAGAGRAAAILDGPAGSSGAARTLRAAARLPSGHP